MYNIKIKISKDLKNKLVEMDSYDIWCESVNFYIDYCKLNSIGDMDQIKESIQSSINSSDINNLLLFILWFKLKKVVK